MNLPLNVRPIKDRHGKTRYRFRRAGLLSRYLRGEPGTAEFEASYRHCIDPSNPPATSRPPKRGRKPILSAFKGVSVVYFAGQPGGAVKIGTTVDLPGRMKKLQTGSPLPLRLLAVVEGGPALEAEYHSRFSDCHLHGEWFKGRPVRDEINRLKRVTNCPTIYPAKLSNPKKRRKTDVRK